MDEAYESIEIPYETGEVHFRFERVKSPDGKKWIRHGLYREHHQNGALLSEGRYQNGVEEGFWRHCYPNGQAASEGEYRGGKEHGCWRFWNVTGTAEPEVFYVMGIPQNPESDIENG